MQSSRRYTRREMLELAGKATLASAIAPAVSLAVTESSAQAAGAIVGDPVAAKVGEKILLGGGNAIDAAVAVAFAAGICSPSKCGIGGYGGFAVIALAGGKKITAIDFNSTAPTAARPDMYPLNEKGQVVGAVNTTGWLAAGVPGTAAGLDLVLTRYGTRALRDVLEPAIRMCEEGVYVAPVKGIDDASHNDPSPESGQTAGAPPQKKRNLALAALLKTLSRRNATESFYRGDIATKIAAAFQRHGGLVTVDDLAAYRALEVEPLRLEWNGLTLHTAPLTATGLLLLEAFSVLKALDWPRLDPAQRLHAKLEALRIAWADRLRTFGDPAQVNVPVAELLSPAHLDAAAEKVSAAIKSAQPVTQQVDASRAGGTVNISAADRQGNLIAMTLTHGGSYGARVAVDELGMVLGHGLSRFDPRPGLPNSPGPRKRPMTNMSPTIVTRDGSAVLAVGAAGGTRIPNSIYEVLLNYVGLGAPLHAALAAPRLDCNGTLSLGLEQGYSAEDEAFFKKIGYKTTRVASAYVSAAAFEPKTNACHGLSRGGAPEPIAR
jgi:gamma-glutamyltranspeptidase/glutathione hydrolase